MVVVPAKGRARDDVDVTFAETAVSIDIKLGQGTSFVFVRQPLLQTLSSLPPVAHARVAAWS